MTMTAIAILTLSAAVLCVWMDHATRKAIAARQSRDLTVSHSTARVVSLMREATGRATWRRS